MRFDGRSNRQRKGLGKTCLLLTGLLVFSAMASGRPQDPAVQSGATLPSLAGQLGDQIGGQSQTSGPPQPADRVPSAPPTAVPKDTQTTPQTSVQKPMEQSPPVKARTLELTDFQQLVAASLGQVLPIYGQNLFENVPTTFAPVDRVPVTADYVIGPGDELLIGRGVRSTLTFIPASTGAARSIFPRSET